jgi:hypothetical protein
MIPFFKIFGIIAKTFTKPAAKLLKSVFYSRVNLFRPHFIWFGNSLYAIELRINRAFLGVKAPTGKNQGSQQLPDDQAFDYASSFLLEVCLVYGILMYIAITEVKKSMDDKKKMKNDLESLLSSIMAVNEQLQAAHERNLVLEKMILDLKGGNDELEKGVGNLKNAVTLQQKIIEESEKVYRKSLEEQDKELDHVKKTIETRKTESNKTSGSEEIQSPGTV